MHAARRAAGQRHVVWPEQLAAAGRASAEERSGSAWRRRLLLLDPADPDGAAASSTTISQGACSASLTRAAAPTGTTSTLAIASARRRPMENHKHRFNWNSPIAVSPLTARRCRSSAARCCFKSTDHGQSWERSSAPISRTNDQEASRRTSGEPIVVDNTAAEFHCTILTIAPSPLDSNVIWVGTDDGNVQVTRDGGKTWSERRSGTCQASSRTRGSRPVEASHSRRRHGVRRGRSPSGRRLHAVRVHDDRLSARRGRASPAICRRRRRLGARRRARIRRTETCSTSAPSWALDRRATAASALGVDSAATCRRRRSRDIQIHPRDNDLIARDARPRHLRRGRHHAAAAHRRGGGRECAALRHPPRHAVDGVSWRRQPGQSVWSGPNRPAGATHQLTGLKTSTPGRCVVSLIADKSGKTIRTIRNAPHAPGVNRTVWDLRYDAPVGGAGAERRGAGAQPAAAVGAGAGPAEEAPGGGRFGRGGAGPVVPGEYTVILRRRRRGSEEDRRGGDGSAGAPRRGRSPRRSTRR